MWRPMRWAQGWGYGLASSRNVMQRRVNVLSVEFVRHLPYTIASSLIAMVAIWYFGMTQSQQRIGNDWTSEVQWSFHVLHPLHVFLSAITTTAVIWHFDRRLLKTLIIGLGSVVPCALSDYIVPFVGGRLLGQMMELHICLIEHPTLILPFLLLGILSGLLFEERVSGHSVFSHGVHVFISSSAALLYLVSFGFTGWMTDIQLVFPVLLVVVIAVWIPCCISDIVIPLSAIHQGKRHEPSTVHRPRTRATRFG